MTKHIMTEWGTAIKVIESTTELHLIIMQLSQHCEVRSCEQYVNFLNTKLCIVA